MIQASDLRFNNWVEKFTDWGDSLGYSPILPEEFLAIHTKPERVNPILLTEEILLKCGFENDYKSLYAIYLPNCGGYFHIKYNAHNNGFYVVLEGFYASRRIKSVHQLQNTIFALTGEELKIEL